MLQHKFGGYAATQYYANSRWLELTKNCIVWCRCVMCTMILHSCHDLVILIFNYRGIGEFMLNVYVICQECGGRIRRCD
jgi:hypothetical protein